MRSRRPTAPDFAAARAVLDSLDDPGPHVCAAVSGGPDSMALALVLADWCADTGRGFSALIVDHALRAGSAAEARMVAGWLGDLGLGATVLRRTGPRPSSAIQEIARRDRYDLMLARCRQIGAATLCTGHHADDQATTVVMRALRGSGLDGLGGIRIVSVRDGMRLVRPLLGMRKADLVDWLERAGVPFVRDPSNDSDRFARNGVDRWLEALPVAGHGVERLARLAGRAARASDALDIWTRRIADTHLSTDRFGVCRLALEAWQAQPAEIRVRLLSRLSTLAGGVAPRLEVVEAAVDDPGGALARSLGRAVLRLRDGAIEARREDRNLPGPTPLAGDGDALWDGRFLVGADHGGGAALAVGPAPVRQGADDIDLAAMARAAGCRAAPGTLPALYEGTRLVAVPHFGWKAADFAGSARVRLTL